MLNVLVTLSFSMALLDLLRRGSGFARCQDEVRYAVAPSAVGPVLFALSRGKIVTARPTSGIPCGACNGCPCAD